MSGRFAPLRSATGYGNRPAIAAAYPAAARIRHPYHTNPKSMSLRGCISALLLSLSATGYAHIPAPKTHIPERFTPDSARLTDPAANERHSRLYDSLQSKSARRKVPRMLYGFFVRPHRDTTSEGRITDESRPLQPLAGKTVGTITIDRQPVFRTDGNWLQRTGNKLHRQTRERILRRDLLFSPGDAFDPELVVRNEQLLRTRTYIADADIDVRLDPADTTRVDLIVRTRDSWSIAVDGSWRSRGRTMIGLEDANILGYGTLLRVKTHFDRRDFTYGGNIVEYVVPNLFGSFFSARISAGRAFDESELVAELHKEFLRPTDYAVGAVYSLLKSRRYIIDRDTSLPVKIRDLDLWCGRARHIPSIRSSVFLTLRFDRTRFDRRPPVAERLHPALHERDLLLLATGLYRERFYTANMVYGFGTKEYLATGYRAELTGGHAWGEFGDEAYLGVGLRAGGFRNIGYLMGAFALGGFIDPENGAWHRNAADARLQWFSNLLMVRRTRLRQFLGLNYTHGWNRATGADEYIRFTDENGLQAFDAYAVGTTRALLNTETVIFTPYQPLGFRIALFGFADFGTIGNSPNLFRNAFFSTLGLGIRIRNERLTFNTIQLRFGVALGKHGAVGSDYFRLSSITQMDHVRYRPARPDIVGFE